MEMPDTKSLRKVADLIEYEGPFLTWFVTRGGDNYLFYWCDVDETYNRWLVFQVGNEAMQAYIDSKAPLRDLVLHPLNNEMIRVDIDNDINYHNITQVIPAELPEDYLPGTNTYYRDFSDEQWQQLCMKHADVLGDLVERIVADDDAGSTIALP